MARANIVSILKKMPPMSNGHKNHEKSPKTSSSKSTDPNRAV
jgi:hypothetical protein